MTLEAVYFLSQIVAAAVIVASLLFVGLQLRQSDKTQRALVHQSTVQRTIALNQRLTDAHIDRQRPGTAAQMFPPTA